MCLFQLGFFALAAAVMLVAGQEGKPAPIAAPNAAPAPLEADPKDLKGAESAYYPYYPYYSAYPYAAYPYYRSYYGYPYAYPYHG